MKSLEIDEKFAVGKMRRVAVLALLAFNFDKTKIII